MRRLLQVITVGFFLSGLLSAQNPRRDRDTFVDLLRRELALRELENSRADINRELALRRQASSLERAIHFQDEQICRSVERSG